MLNFEEIQKVHSRMASTVSGMNSKLGTINASIEKVQADKSRSASWIAEETAKIRNAAMPFFSEELEKLRTDAKLVQAQSAAWESKPYLLSQQRFADSDVQDATIRMAHGMQFARMNKALLEIAAEAAQAEGNLPIVFQIFLINSACVDLDRVEIPQQADCLRAIRECLAFPAKGELTAAMGINSGMSSMRKLQLAREAMA